MAQDEVMPDEMPYFNGCWEIESKDAKRQCSNERLVKYILGVLEYPEAARTSRTEGTVYLSFIVTEDGEVGDVEVLHGIGNGCDEAAIRIVREMPPWEPALLEGKPIPARMSLPIQFALGQEKRNGQNYRIIWSNMTDRQSLSRQEIMDNLTTPISLLDLKGNKIQFNELTFIRTKKERFKDASSAGQITSAMRKLVRRLKKGNYFSIVATLQIAGQFEYIEKEWLIE